MDKLLEISELLSNFTLYDVEGGEPNNPIEKKFEGSGDKVRLTIASANERWKDCYITLLEVNGERKSIERYEANLDNHDDTVEKLSSIFSNKGIDIETCEIMIHIYQYTQEVYPTFVFNEELGETSPHHDDENCYYYCKYDETGIIKENVFARLFELNKDKISEDLRNNEILTMEGRWYDYSFPKAVDFINKMEDSDDKELLKQLVERTENTKFLGFRTRKHPGELLPDEMPEFDDCVSGNKFYIWSIRMPYEVWGYDVGCACGIEDELKY